MRLKTGPGRGAGCAVSATIALKAHFWNTQPERLSTFDLRVGLKTLGQKVGSRELEVVEVEIS